MRTRYFLFPPLIMLALLVSACVAPTPAAPAAPPAEEAEVPAEKIELSMICRCVAGGVNNNMVRWVLDYVKPTFERQMTLEGRDVTVELVQFGGSDEALKEQYALDLPVGRGHDLMAFDGFWIPEFVEGGLLEPLDEIAGPEVNDWEGWNHISPGLQELLGFKGKRFGIAMGTDVRMIFVRKDLFEQAGIEMPWQPTSWDELLDTARKIKAALPDVVPLQINAGTSMGEATTMQGYFMVLLGAGNHMYDFDAGKWIVKSPAILDTLNFYKTVYVDDELGDARTQLLPDGRQRSFAMFRDGQIAMLVEGDWFWRSVTAPGSEWEVANREETMDWAKMPAEAPGKGYRNQDFVTISGGTGVAMNPNTRHPKEAWELLSLMFSKDGLMAFQDIEPRIRVRDDVPVPGKPFLTETSGALMPYTTARPMLPEYPKISFEAQLMTERVVSGEMTPEEAMEAYAQAVAEIAGPENVIEIPIQ
ncbi:MAG: extracellular solute-binding protein [Anaerolineae bacterium]